MPRASFRPVLIVLALFLFSVNGTWAQETKTVTAEGVAAIQQGALDIARDAAIEDAQKRAVEQAVGIIIDSQTQVENFQLISDKILSQTKGYITRYSVTGERQDSGLLRVAITADVALSKLSDDLSGIGILMSQMHKPRTMILIAEQNIGRDVNAWWTGARGETDMSVVENAFMNKFTEKGFEEVDFSQDVEKIQSMVRMASLANEAEEPEKGPPEPPPPPAEPGTRVEEGTKSPDLAAFLETVPKMGSEVKQRLIDRFKDLPALRKATQDDLMEVQGVGRTTAERIMKALKALKGQ